MVRGPSVMPGYLLTTSRRRRLACRTAGWRPVTWAWSMPTATSRSSAGPRRSSIAAARRSRPTTSRRRLLQHPSVREAAAFAVPHPRLGENVVRGGRAASRCRRHSRGTDGLHLRPSGAVPDAAPRPCPRRACRSGRPARSRGRAVGTAFPTSSGQRPPPAAPLELQIAEIWRRLPEARRDRDRGRLLRDRRRFVAGHGDAAGAGGDHAPARRAVGGAARSLTIRRLWRDLPAPRRQGRGDDPA